mgnify:CR=1 FL=1
MSLPKRGIEERLERLERDWNWAKPIVTKLAKEYDISRQQVNPAKYCKDGLDLQIVSYLIDNLGAGATEIAVALKLEDPEVGRHTIGKRLLRLYKATTTDGWDMITFEKAFRENPITQKRKFRAWWINLDAIDLEEWQKSLGGMKIATPESH